MKGPIKNVNYSEPHVLYRGERVINMAKKLLEPHSPPDFVDISFAVSLYYTLFLPYPIFNEDYKPSTEKESKQLTILKLIMASSRLLDIKKYTIADSTTSTVASAVLVEALSRELQKRMPRPPGGELESSQARGGQGQENVEELRRAVESALENVKEQAAQAKEITNLVAKFAAGVGSSFSLEDSIQDIIRLAKQTDVKAVLEALKSVEDVESCIRRRLVRRTRGELDGYEVGSDIERLVPTELALPHDFFLVRFAECALLLYRKVVQESKGPFYVLLDKSGSMMGLKIVWAKAVALALALRAARERRTFFIRFFDSIPYPSMKLSKRIRGRDVIKLLEYVARVRANGGTDITRAILAATEDILMLRSHNIADIILITDGEDKISIEIVRRNLARANARLHTVMIHGNNPDLKMVSDTYMTVTKLSRDEALKVVRI